MGNVEGQRPILIHAATRTQWSLLGRLAVRLTHAGEPLWLSREGGEPDIAGPGLADHPASDFEEFAAAVGAAEVTPRLESWVPARLRERLLGASRYRAFLTLHRTRLEAARRLVRLAKPRLLVVAEDGVAGNCWIIRAAEETGIPVLVVPYGFGSRRDFDNALAQKQRAGDLILATDEDGARVAASCPRWIRSTPFGPALLFPPDYILARERVGLTLRDPWTVHGGPADRIAVESEVMRRHYLREGIPEHKLALTGTVYCDVVHQALGTDPRFSRAFADASRIEPGATRVLVALPPSYQGERGEQAEFDSYRELCAQTLGFLRDLPGAVVTVSIHPATLPEDRAAIQDLGLAISDGYVVELLARHDVYVTCFSSTIRWAIACRKPTVNYDMYAFRLDDYAAVPGVITVEKQAGFRAAVQALVQDDVHYRALAGGLAEVSEDWGVIDGRNFERIHALIRQLAARAG